MEPKTTVENQKPLWKTKNPLWNSEILLWKTKNPLWNKQTKESTVEDMVTKKIEI